MPAVTIGYDPQHGTVTVEDRIIGWVRHGSTGDPDVWEGNYWYAIERGPTAHVGGFGYCTRHAAMGALLDVAWMETAN